MDQVLEKPVFIQQLRLESHVVDPEISGYARKKLREHGRNGGKASAAARRRRKAEEEMLASDRQLSLLEEFHNRGIEANEHICPID